MTIKTRHLEVAFSDPNKVSANFTINEEFKARLGFPQLLVKFQIEKQVSSEPNAATLTIHGLSPRHSAALDFVFDLFATKFGATCTIRGGFLETKISQLYAGVVTNAVTIREGPEFITKISIRNNYFELMRRPVKYLANEGTTKAQALLAIVKNGGGSISTEQTNQVNERLGKFLYAEDEIIQGSLDNVLEGFNRTLYPRIAIYWDDAGVNVSPPGAYVLGRPIKIFSAQNGLIGNPEPTSSGFNFELQLNGNLRISDPIQLKSDVFSRLITSLGGSLNTRAAFTNTRAFERIGISSLYKIIHTGDNREGEFKTMCETKFINILRQAGL